MDGKSKNKIAGDSDLRNSFIAVLLLDVQSALELVESENRQTDRRSALRTIMSAIEGVCWIYREHTKSIAIDLELMDPLLNLAMDEKSYSITEQGKLIEQSRFSSITSMFRLTTRLAATINTQIEIDFSSEGWSSFKVAISKRNSVTHPKSVSDLDVTSDDIENAKTGLFWVLSAAVGAMEAINSTALEDLKNLKNLAERLKSGDEKALADYETALKSYYAKPKATL